MTKDSPSLRERDLLYIIHRHISDHGELPIPGQLTDDFGFELNYLLNVVKRLEKKGYIEKQGNLLGLSQKAEQFFLGALKPVRTNSVAPTQIQVLGTVKAGKTTAEELEVDLHDEGERLLLPDTKLEKSSYALRVVGRSMEHEGIFDGDFVIVEEFNGIDWPKQGDLIVAKYFPLENEKEDALDEVSETEYMDLTLKIYSEQIQQNKKLYRLGWRKGNLSNPYMILASRLIPKGKVIGVYRNMRGLKFAS